MGLPAYLWIHHLTRALLKLKTLSSTLRNEVRLKIHPLSSVKLFLPSIHLFIHSFIHILIYFDHKYSCSLIPEREGSFLTTWAQSSSPSFLRTHMSHRHTCTSPHVFLTIQVEPRGFLDQAPCLLSAPTRSGSRHSLHLVVLVVSIQGCGCRRWKRQVSNPFLD